MPPKKLTATLVIMASVGAVALSFILPAMMTFIGMPNLFKPDPVVVTGSSPAVEQLQAMGELVVVRVAVADVLTADGAGYKGSWLIKGDALISVDLAKAEFTDVDEEQKRFVIQLPAPRVIQPRVDHERTRTWAVSKTTWVPFAGDPDKLRDQVMQEAQRLVEFACSNDDIIRQGQENTEILLTPMYKHLGWHVLIDWLPSESAQPAGD